MEEGFKGTQMGNEDLSFQREIVNRLLEERGPLTEEELRVAVGGHLAPEATSHLVCLSDGTWALPDSAAAYADVALKLAGQGPVTRNAFTRMAKKHRNLIAAVKEGREVEPFIILPDGKITVSFHPVGQQELRRREMVGRVRARMKRLAEEKVFLSQTDFKGEERQVAAGEARAEGWVRVKLGRKEYWCSPALHPAWHVAAELEFLTGLSFPGGNESVVPAVYLAENSVTVEEAARLLLIGVEEVIALCGAGELSSFFMDGIPRVWRQSVRALRGRTSVREVLRRAEKIKVADAARMLGLPEEMIRQLVRDGYLHWAGRTAGRWKNDYLLRRGEVEDLLRILPELRKKWLAFGTEGGERRRARRPRRRRPRTAGTERPAAPAAGREFELDPFQVKAIQLLEEGYSVLVAAPTGTGKTVIAEKIIGRVLEKKKGIIYTSPLKALSNQKYRDFCEMFGRDRVGLITGDVSINERAPLLVMTTEIFRNWCFSNPEWMDDISHVIFDEIHYLDDADRGTAWEESIIFAPAHIRMLGLSATVPNVYELAEWMSEVRRSPVLVVEEKKRAVPLEIRWVTSDGRVLEEEEAREEIEIACQESGRLAGWADAGE